MSPLQRMADASTEIMWFSRVRTAGEMSELSRLIEEPKLEGDPVADLQMWRKWTKIAHKV